MPFSKMGVAIVVIALLPLAGVVTIWQFGSGDTAIASGSRASRTAHGKSSVGAFRDEKLKRLTQQYTSLNEGVSVRMKAGTELAPIEFLNRELKREGQKWRVRKVDGLVADTYDIS